jgi:hypothetical protein
MLIQSLGLAKLLMIIRIVSPSLPELSLMQILL